MRTIIAKLPEGETVRADVTAHANLEQSLSEWLDEHHVPLNTRCGGRGLCRGCQVRTGGETRRSCQIALRNLPEGEIFLEIPPASLRDAHLDGVSIFEIGIETPPLDPDRTGLGAAIDIGTTTVAVALWDLATGECRATATRANAQRRYGDDVLSRITYCAGDEAGIGNLRAALVGNTLAPLFAEVCREAGVDPGEIWCGVVSGNPVMLHTLAGESLGGFSRFPFHPVFLDARTLDAAQMGLPFQAPLDLLPALGPFVGADISAGALAAGLLQAEPPALLIDFGTNGEILLKHADGYLATATAAGPAFEGGRLNCGATAGPGIVSHLNFHDAEDAWMLADSEGKTRRFRGISGAAYIDFLAEALRIDLLQVSGRFDPDNAHFRLEKNGEGENVVRLGKEIVVSEADVAELIQAKAAIGGGALTLMREVGLNPADLRTVYVAGGFGYHLDPDHARVIGLLPDVPPERIRIVGNSSLGGASLLLLSSAMRRQLAFLRQSTTVIELNQSVHFSDFFIDAMTLEPLGSAE